MKHIGKIVTAILSLLTFEAFGFEYNSLPWPIEPTFSEIQDATSNLIPVGSSRKGLIPTISVNGKVERIGIKIESDAPTFTLMDEFIAYFEQRGYKTIFVCHDRECGGFDFRSQLEVLPSPKMYVDLRNFHYLTAKSINDSSSYATVLVSRSSSSGFAQIDIINGVNNLNLNSNTDKVSEPLIRQLESTGHVVLNTLEFASGSPDLEPKEYSQLGELADYLKRNPNVSILLVGHTDSKGSRVGNFELSKQRAASVVERLIDKHGVNPDQISAEGIGFLSPVASNNTPEGRQSNRRVEAVLITN